MTKALKGGFSLGRLTKGESFCPKSVIRKGMQAGTAYAQKQDMSYGRTVNGQDGCTILFYGISFLF